MERRIVILSNGDPLLARLLPALEARGVRPHALVLYAPSALREWRALSPRGRALAAPLVPLRWLRRRLRLVPGRLTRRRVGRIRVTGPLNGPRMLSDLRRQEPDVLFLAGCGIVSPGLLSIPREGTLNVHPALLPWVRGNGAIDNSLLRHVPLGCTAHWVDSGIDTGRVITRRLVSVAGGETRSELADRLMNLWAEMTAGLVADALRAPLPPGTAQPARHPLGTHARDLLARRRADDAIAASVPHALFERWAPLCDPADLSLPAHVNDPTPLEPSRFPAGAGPAEGPR